MVNNSININKANNHLSSLESLTRHLISWLTTWVFDSPVTWVFDSSLESLTHHLSSLSPWLTTSIPWLTTWVFTHHLSSWLTTWVLDSPLESLTHHLSPWLTTCVWDSPFCAQNNKECTSGTCDLFLVGTRQHFILQGSLNLILIILDITLISFI